MSDHGLDLLVLGAPEQIRALRVWLEQGRLEPAGARSGL